MNDPEARALGRKIAFHRSQKGWSQREFGALIQRDDGHDKLPGDGHEAARWRT